jgi:proteasome assembly chaperone (PAC2) family protein
MAEAQRQPFEFWKKPEADEVYLLAGFRQWADAGSVSSGLPLYIVQQTRAEPIGRMSPDGFYLFQVPGTHDLMRPVVRFESGFPESLESQRNDFYYYTDGPRGVVVFLGDEPNLDIERYVATLLSAARSLGVKRIIGFGGVYGELPYDKDRVISCNFSQRRLKPELDNLAVTFSDYHGGASIGSVLCKRSGEQGMEYVGLYALVPAYDFSLAMQPGNSIRIENDFFAWLAVMRRVNFMLKLGFDLHDLDEKSRQLVDVVKSKLDELEEAAPQLGLSEYIDKLSEDFTEPNFNPLDQVWEDELKRLMDKFDDDDPTQAEDPPDR